MDIYTTANIPFTTAVFGGEAKVFTLYGVISVDSGGNTVRTPDPFVGKCVVSMKDSAVHGDSVRDRADSGTCRI